MASQNCTTTSEKDCYQIGTTWDGWEITVTEKDEDGNPVETDLAGCTGLIQFRQHSKNGELGLEIDDMVFSGDKITFAPRAPGEFLLHEGTWYGDLKVTWPDGSRYSILSVIVTVTKGSTT